MAEAATGETKQSDRKQLALRELKARVADLPGQPETTDTFYLRWLRARRYNVDKAEDMLRNHVKFRAEMGADTILDWTPPEVLRKCFPCGFFGEDRDGHPVWYDNMGNLDFKGIHRSARKEDIVKLKVQHLEMTAKVCQEFSERKGRYIGKATSVLDLENLSYQRHYYWPGIQLFRELIAMFEANYPQRTNRIIVVKAPKIFPVAYNLIQRFLHDYTKRKIVILGSNWKEDLQQYIAPDQLPQAYGGTRCEPDPWCTDFINPGCDVPLDFYLSNQTATRREDMERVVVGRGGKYELEYSIEFPGSLLVWEFVTVEYDIGFGCYYKRTQARKELDEVVPMKRRNSHIIPESGGHICEQIGTYMVKFDNSYSWARPKEVFYAVKVELPGEMQPAVPLGDSQLAISPEAPLTSDMSELLGVDDEYADMEDEFFDCSDQATVSSKQATV